MLEGINRQLAAVTGLRSRLTPAAKRRIEAVDRAIQDFEVHNNRQHLVYATLLAPKNNDKDRAKLRGVLRSMAERPDDPRAAMTFDGYIPATHSLGNIGDGDDVVMEIQTRSGAYLGSSDSLPDADHIVGRGRTLKPVGVRQVEVVKPDGSTGTRWVVQMTDVTDDGRTTARD